MIDIIATTTSSRIEFFKNTFVMKTVDLTHESSVSALCNGRYLLMINKCIWKLKKVIKKSQSGHKMYKNQQKQAFRKQNVYNIH